MAADSADNQYLLSLDGAPLACAGLELQILNCSLQSGASSGSTDDFFQNVSTCRLNRLFIPNNQGSALDLVDAMARLFVAACEYSLAADVPYLSVMPDRNLIDLVRRVAVPLVGKPSLDFMAGMLPYQIEVTYGFADAIREFYAIEGPLLAHAFVPPAIWANENESARARSKGRLQIHRPLAASD